MSNVLVNSRLSLFPHVPPYHVFLPYWREYTSPPCAALTQEEWQFPAQIMPVVRDVVQHAGFRVKKVHNNGFRRNIVYITCGLFAFSVKVKRERTGLMLLEDKITFIIQPGAMTF